MEDGVVEKGLGAPMVKQLLAALLGVMLVQSFAICSESNFEMMEVPIVARVVAQVDDQMTDANPSCSVRMHDGTRDDPARIMKLEPTKDAAEAAAADRPQIASAAYGRAHKPAIREARNRRHQSINEATNVEAAAVR